MKLPNRKIGRWAAKKLGKKWYFTRKPCRHGHVDRRYVSSGKCRRCAGVNYKPAKRHVGGTAEERAASGAARREAAARGEARYFSIRPCAEGHIGDHYTSTGGCCTCQRLFRTYDMRVSDMIAVLRKEMPKLLKEFGL